MGLKPTGSVFWAFFLVLFPVAVQLSSSRCVTYKHTEICGLKGSSLKIPCFYPKRVQVISISGWYKEIHSNMKPKPLNKRPAYSHERGNNDCTMKLKDLKMSDAAVYFFIYKFRNVKGHNKTCKGASGVRLNISESAVSVRVMELVKGQNVPVADWTVMEGQKIMLTCVPTCAANLNSNPGYTWYKNRLQLNGSRANLSSLSLDPISNKDMDSYVCAMIGYKAHPSSTVKLRVLSVPRNTVSDEIPDGGLKNGCDAQSSTDKIMFTFSMMLALCVCVGWVITIMVAMLAHNVKQKKKKGRRCASSVPRPPDPYMALNISSMSAEYNTLDTVRRCSAADTIYENICQPGNCMK